MRVLVTGGTGFVGSHTVAALRSAGHRVRIFVRSAATIDPALGPHALTRGDVEHVVGDVNDVASVRRALEGCDALVHAGSAYLLGVPFWKARAMVRTNVGGTGNVLGAAHAAGLDPIVYVSSSFAIAPAESAVVTEDTPVGTPPEPYPRSKAQAETFARELQQKGAPVVITYPGGVWGPHDPHFGETAELVAAIVKGRARFTLDGTVPLSDVREVARLHAAVLEPRQGPRRYLVPSHSPRLTEVIRLIAEETGRSIPTTVVPAPVALVPTRLMSWIQAVTPFRLPFSYAGPWLVSRSHVYGESRAERELGIRARPFGDTVRDTLAWIAGTGRLDADLLGEIAEGAVDV